jgi:Flp pilus assembly protein TadD
VLNNRACALGALGRFEEALANLGRAATLKPDDRTTLANREVLSQARAAHAESSLSAARVEVAK